MLHHQKTKPGNGEIVDIKNYNIVNYNFMEYK